MTIMTMTEHNYNDYHIISLEGDFDAEAVRVYEQHFERLSKNKNKGIVFDMSNVSFLDSSGVGAMVFLFKRLIAEQRELKLTGLNGQPARLIQLLRIDKTINTFGNLNNFMTRH